MKYRKRKCKICESEIKVILMTMGSRMSNSMTTKRITELGSDEGVFFCYNHGISKKVSGCWFCNSCWGKILKYKNE